MTDTDLHDRLHHLADQVDQRTEGDAGLHGPDLWQRGRCYQRLRRTGTAVIAAAAVVVAVVVTGVSWQQAGPLPAAAPAGAPVALPDRIHEPSPWLPGTAEKGPPGQLVALIETERGGWFGSSWGVVGVSATTGDYRFLDLPDALHEQNQAPALAPDGKRVAYWLLGRPRGSPHTREQGRAVVGVAVYDTATGGVDRHLIETEHGLGRGELAWVDHDTLVISHSQERAGDDGSLNMRSQAAFAPTLVWDVGDAAPRVLEGVGLLPPMFGPSVGGRVVTTVDNGLLVLGESLPGGRTGLIKGGEDLYPVVALDLAGNRLAAVWSGNGRMPNRIAVGTVPEDPRDDLTFEILPRTNHTHRVLAWIDAERVVVERRSDPKVEPLRIAAFVVDVETGESTQLIDLPETFANRIHWATELLAAPVVERPAPPTPLSPRLTAGLLLAALVGGVLGIVGWRRRVQP